MIIYLIIYFLILFFTIFFIFYPKHKLEKKVLICFLIILGIVAGTRYYTGQDYQSYVYTFDNIKLNSDTEELFTGIVFILKKYFENEIVFLFFSVLNMVFLYKILTKVLYQNLFLGLYIYITFYFLQNDLGLIRLSLAILICILAINNLYFNPSKSFKNIVYIIIAIFIHRTALIFLLSYLILKIKFINRKILFFFIVTSMLLARYVINKDLVLVTGNFFNSPKLISMYYGNYVFKIGFSFYQIWLFITSLFITFYKTKDDKDLYLSKLYLLGIFYYFLLQNLAIFSGRFSMALILENIILFPKIINDCRNKYLKFILYSTILVLGAYMYFRYLNRYLEVYIPYKSWLL